LSDIRMVVVFLFIAGSYYCCGSIGEAAIIPTGEKGSNEKRGIPPTEVGGLFRLSLQRAARPSSLFLSLYPRAARVEKDRKNENPRCALCRLGLNNPPTAVGGIREAVRPSCVG
jgi:hypothetical protein